ncbi:MAG: protein-export chaperone SecB [Chitinivibrionales bacterium]|nr:protein-export chaperone SecB [Chitinivibrionales bacterium]
MNEAIITLGEIKLISLNFHLNTIQSVKNEIAYSPEISVCYNSHESNLIVDLGVKASSDDLPFVIKSEHQGLFHLNSQNIPKEVVERIARVNCAAIMFPFAREIIAEMTRKAGFPPLLLPVVNFVKYDEAQNKIENNQESKS